MLPMHMNILLVWSSFGLYVTILYVSPYSIWLLTFMRFSHFLRKPCPVLMHDARKCHGSQSWNIFAHNKPTQLPLHLPCINSRILTKPASLGLVLCRDLLSCRDCAAHSPPTFRHAMSATNFAKSQCLGTGNKNRATKPRPRISIYCARVFCLRQTCLQSIRGSTKRTVSYM